METVGLAERISKRLFLSTMLNLTDAEFAASYAAGAGFIQLGTMLVEAETAEYSPYRDRWPKAFLPNDGAAMCDLLRREIVTVKSGVGEVPICLSIAGSGLAGVCGAIRAFGEAGGDFVELNVHGRLDPWASQGYLAGMSLPAYRDRLVAWAEELAALDIPLVIKFRTDIDVDMRQVCSDLAHVPLFGVHFNVRDVAIKKPNLAFVKSIRSAVEGELLCSGYAWTADAVKALFEAGADAVGLAQPIAKDPGLFAKLARALE